MTNSRFLLGGIAIVAALGGLVFGIDSGIIATTLSHDTFKLYMYGPSLSNPSLTGAIVSVYNAGQAVGSACSSWSADRFSRRYTIGLAGVIATLGAALQAGAAHVAMMIMGRLLAGLACGMILSTVPVYLAEIAPAERRGFLVGLQGMMIAIGFATANWIGYGGAFASGQAQWRVPLAMQCPAAIALTIGCIFIPFSPRWLCQQERYDEAKAVIARLHAGKGHEYWEHEYSQIHQQLALERQAHNVSWGPALAQLFSKQYRRRTVTACFILAMGQLSGSTVIQNYQGIFYKLVGFVGKKSLLISGVYGMMGVIGQIIYLTVVADKWRRTTTLWCGSLFLCIMISICMALSAHFGTGSTADAAGARGAIASIFIYSTGYAIFFNAMVWVVPSELFPFFLRAKGLALAVFTKAVVAIVLAQITPVALQQVKWRYYALFISTNFCAAIVYFFFLPETRGKTLEEIGELFGDTVVSGNDWSNKMEGATDEKAQVTNEHKENRV